MGSTCLYFYTIFLKDLGNTALTVVGNVSRILFTETHVLKKMHERDLSFGQDISHLLSMGTSRRNKRHSELEMIPVLNLKIK
jgi:hypothetical protein